MGDKISGADIFIYDTFLIMETLHSETAHKYANIHRVMKEIENSEWYQAYKASNKWHTQLNWHPAHIHNVLEKWKNFRDSLLIFSNNKRDINKASSKIGESIIFQVFDPIINKQY